MDASVVVIESRLGRRGVLASGRRKGVIGSSHGSLKSARHPICSLASTAATEKGVVTTVHAVEREVTRLLMLWESTVEDRRLVT